jgi:SnoaL-like domain
MSTQTGSTEADRRLLQDYFDAMDAGGDLARFLTEDVVWVNTDTGERFEGRQAVKDYIRVLHTEMFDAVPEGRYLGVFEGHAFLEGDFVGTATDLRVPFCLVYDLSGAGISAMRLYMSFAPLVAHPGARR